MAEERGLVVDKEGFDIAMNEARERSRNAQNKVCSPVLYILTSINALVYILVC